MRATLAKLVEMVRAEAGHSLAVSQGLNSEETIKQLIRRAEEELWSAFEWPKLETRWDIDIHFDQYEYPFPAKLQYEQIKKVYWCNKGGHEWFPVKFGLPEDAILPNGAIATYESGPRVYLWGIYFNTTANESRIRVWPNPSTDGTMRLVGQGALNPIIADDDYCTLDANLIVLRVASRLLARAKAADAEMVDQSFQRHLQKVQARMNSDKQKVSTLGFTRIAEAHRLRYGKDYVN